MGRPTLFDTLPDRQKILAANMFLRNESWDTIFKYIDLEDTLTARKLTEELAERLDTPLSEPIFLVYIDLAQTEHIMAMAAEKAEGYSPRHMSEYAKLSTHRIKLVNQLDNLLEKEEARGHIWEPTFDINSLEYRIFKAAMTLVLEQETSVDDGFDGLNPEEQSRFYQVLAESA